MGEGPAKSFGSRGGGDDCAGDVVVVGEGDLVGITCGRPGTCRRVFDHLLGILLRRVGREAPRLTKANVAALQGYSWPGNVRELQHVLERALITIRGERLIFDSLTNETPVSSDPATVDSTGDPEAVMTEREVRAIEVQNIRRALRLAGNKIAGPGGAAELLEIKPTTLASRIKKLRIKRH